MTGCIAINKPTGISSFTAVKKIRKLTGIKKVGHAGTLDPLASGLLIVCIGREATKKIDTFVDMSKKYTTTIDLRAFSETDDAEGPLYPVNVRHIPTYTQVENVVQSFVGPQSQTPPTYSAIKIGGKRQYQKARNNTDQKNITLPQRNIVIYSLTIEEYQWPYLTLHISCSKGTYIRSVARDIGTALKTGGYVKALTRTAIGPYTLDEAYNLDEITHIDESMFISTNTDSEYV